MSQRTMIHLMTEILQSQQRCLKVCYYYYQTSIACLIHLGDKHDTVCNLINSPALSITII